MKVNFSVLKIVLFSQTEELIKLSAVSCKELSAIFKSSSDTYSLHKTRENKSCRGPDIHCIWGEFVMSTSYRVNIKRLQTERESEEEGKGEAQGEKRGAG